MRLEVGEVLRRVARGIAAAREQRHGFRLAQAPRLDQQEIVDQHALFLDAGAVGRHRARRGAADIGLVAARGDIEPHRPRAVLGEDRHDHRHVGKMRAAVIGRVQHIDVARLHAAPVGALRARADHRAHAFAHRAQMNRQMRRVGDKRSGAVEQRAGKIQPLLDIHRIGGVLQRHAHLLGDRHEEIVEHFQHHRIDAGADRRAGTPRLRALQHEIAPPVDPRAPSGLDERGRRRLDDDRRPGKFCPGTERFAVIDRDRVRAAIEEDVRLRDGLRLGGPVRQLRDRIVGHVGGAHRLGRHGFDDQRLFRHHETIALPMRRGEGGRHLVERPVRDRQRRVGAVIFHVCPLQHADAALIDALGAHLGSARLAKLRQGRPQSRHQRRRQRRLHRLLLHRTQIGEPHPVGRQHARQRVDIYPGHAERVGHQARMLPARTAKAGERVLRHVMAALDRDLLDRVRHVLDRDLDESFRDRGGAAGVAGGGGNLPPRAPRTFLTHDRVVERLVALRLRTRAGKTRGCSWPSIQSLQLGDGERPAIAR